MELFERGDILRDLLAHLARAVQGDGRLVLLGGEAGIGKTTVVRRLTELANPRQVRVLYGACDPLATPCPLGPIIDIVPQLGEALDQALMRVLAGADHPVAVFRALLAELVGGDQATLLIFEDVHWADEATMDLLRFLGRRVQVAHVLLVVTYRDDEIGRSHPLAVMRGDLATCPAVHRRSLAPLSREAVARLSTGSGRDAEEVYRVSNGNPFFVTEILAAPSGQVPATVRDAVLGRLARLSVPARCVVEAVAVIGARTTTELLTAVEPGTEGKVEEAFAAGMLCAQDGVIAFRHELARRAVLDAIPGYRRIELHRRVLAALRSRPMETEDFASLAHHGEQAGDEAAVLEYAVAAAAHAAVLGAHREAAAHYEHALRHAGSLPLDQRAALLERLSYECFLTRQVKEAVTSLQTAIGIRRQTGDRLREGDDLQLLAQMLWPLGRTSLALKVGQEGVRVLKSLEPSRELAWAYVNQIRWATVAQDAVSARAYAQRAIALGESFGEPALVAEARYLAALARVLCTGQDWEELEEVASWAAEHGLKEPVTVMVGTAWFATLNRDLPRAFAAIDRATAYCLDHDLITYLLICRGFYARALLYQGRWAEAVEVAAAVLDHPDLPPYVRLPPLGVLGLARARRGEPEVWPPLDEAAGLAEPTEHLLLGPVWEARAESAWLAGDDARAQAEALRGLTSVTEQSNPWLAGGLACWIHRTGGTCPAVPAAEPYALELAGDWQAATEAWERLGFPYMAALTRLDGDAPALRQALATFESLGAYPAAARARERMRMLGLRPAAVGPRTATRANPYGLTDRQLEILGLLGKGLSDAEIAAQLYITPKTAGHHVSAVLAKLGVHTRHEAARALANPEGPAGSERGPSPGAGQRPY